MRSSNLRIFLLGGLLVAVGLAMLVSGFASSAPDGLNKVAEDHGIAAGARAHLFENGPLAGYAVKGVGDDRLSTAISGLIGVLVNACQDHRRRAGLRPAVVRPTSCVRPGVRAGGRPSRGGRPRRRGRR